MAIRIKDSGASPPESAEKPTIAAVPSEPAPKEAPTSPRSEYLADLDLVEPFDSLTRIAFRRIKMRHLREIMGPDKKTAQLAKFIEECAEPRMSREQIERLSSDDVSQIEDILAYGLSGIDDQEGGNEGGVFEAGIATRGAWDKESRVYTLAYPLRLQQTTGEVELTEIHFVKSVDFKRMSSMLNADDWLRRLTEFLRIYGRPAEGLSIPLVQNITDGLDSADVFMINREVVPSVTGNSREQRRWKPR